MQFKDKILRKKKEVVYEPIELIEVPSNSFCSKCQSVDSRLLKDTANLAVFTLNIVANQLGVKHKTLEKTCKALKDWAWKQQKFEMLKLKKRSKQ
jgi:hypothetical protein